MAKAGAIRAGAAFVELFADSSRLVRGLKGASARLKAFGASVSAMGGEMLLIGGLMAVPLVAAGKVFASLGHDLEHASERTGIAVESLSELGYAAELSGTNLEGLELAVRRMQKAIYAASTGGAEANASLAAIGLTIGQIQNLKPEEQFLAIADALAAIQDPTQKAALAMKIFGRSGTSMIPMLGEMRALRDEAKAWGFTISSVDAKASADFAKSLERLTMALKIVAFSIGAELGSALKQTFIDVARATGNVRKFIKDNGGLIITIAKVVGILIAAGAAMWLLGGAIKMLSIAMTALVIAIKLVHVALVILLNPVGAIVVAVLAVGVVILKITGVWDSAVSSMKATFTEFWGAIVSAVMSGNLSAALNVVTSAIKLIWAKTIGWMQLQWVNLWGGMRLVYEVVVNSFTIIWLRMINGLQVAWATFAAWHMKSVETTANWIAKKWAWVEGTIAGRSEEDIAFMQRHIDQQSALEMNRIDRTHAAAIKATDDENKAAANLAEKLHAANIARIEAETIAREGGIQAEVDAARAQYAAALAAAKAARTAAPGGTPGGGPSAGPGGGGVMVGRSLGTFNPAAIRSLIGPQDRILAVNQAQLVQLQKIAAAIIGGPIGAAAAAIGVI